MAAVEDPSKEEWSQAFHAPSSPYRWLDESRVVEKGFAPFRVIRFIDGPSCPCPQQQSRPQDRSYQRLPGGVWFHTDVFSDEVKAELLDLADFVAGSEHCSHFIALFVRCFETDTAARHSEPVHRIISRIEQFDSQGLHCSPAVVAKIIRDFANYQPPSMTPDEDRHHD
jgi:hypothetical protein